MKNKGFSLIEVLIFVSVFALFFVVAIAVVTVSLKNMKTNEHKILATRYAEELQEWLRSEKEIDWNVFTVHSSASPGSTYCFNSAISPIWPGAGACAGFTGVVGSDNPQIFKRQAVLVSTGANPVSQVTAQITVSWQEANQPFQVQLNSVFNPWE